MTTTTVGPKPLPSQYQQVIEKCDEMGWDIEKSPTSVKVVPPQGSKVKSFSMPRNNPWAPPQLAVELKKNGFLGAYDQWKKSQGGEATAEDKQEPKATVAAKPGKPVRVCPECKADPNVKEPFSATHPPALGVHRRYAHGILGGSSEAARKRGVTATKKAAAKKAPAKKAASASKAVEVPAQRPAAPVSKAEPLINISGLPVSVAAPLGELLNAISATSGNNEDLEKEVQDLRDFRDLVEAEVNDGNKAPVQVVASILSLVKESKQK